MKRLSKLLALILALAMCLSLLAGCGTSSSDSDDTAATTDDTTSAATEAPQDAEEPQEEEPQEEDPFANGVQYPLVTDDSVDLTVFLPLAGFMPLVLGDDGLNGTRGVQLCSEATGVTFTWQEIDQDAYSAQFNIMMVSEDLADIIGTPESYYSGGIDAVIEDGYCIDLTQYKNSYLKDYFQYAEDNDLGEYLKLETSDTGKICSIWSLAQSTTLGLIVRQDWLDQLGMEIPETYDEVHDVLTAMQVQLGVASPMYMTSAFSYGSSSSNSLFTGGYNTATGAQVGGELDWVVNEDGEAVACCISDELKDYLQLINQWWDEGLISEDSLSITNVGDIKTYTAQGKVGFWVAQTSTFTLEVDDTYNPVAIKNITKEAGDTVRVGNYSNTRGSSGWAISTDCEYPEIAAGVINWFWTEEGYIATNYGEEGVTFNYDENGDVVFTDLILNNDNGYNSLYNSCSEIIYFDFPIFYSLTRKAATFSTQEQYDSQTIWGSNETNELRYFGDLNVEESATYSSLVGDISTYVAENLTKFATGEKSFDEWDAYVEQVESMGIQQLIDVKTAAYQRYLQR